MKLPAFLTRRITPEQAAKVLSDHAREQQAKKLAVTRSLQATILARGGKLSDRALALGRR